MPPYPLTPAEALSLPWLRTLTPEGLVCHLHAMGPEMLGLLTGVLRACAEWFPPTHAPLRLPEQETLMAAHVMALHPEMLLVDESSDATAELKAAADELVRRFDRLMAQSGARSGARVLEHCMAFLGRVDRFEPLYAAWKAANAPGLVAHARARLGRLLACVRQSPVGDDRESAAAVLALVEPKLQSTWLFLLYLPGGTRVVQELDPAFARVLAAHRALCK